MNKNSNKRGKNISKLSKKDKGISPVIATVLLVAMVVVIGLIIFLWFREITQESITKFEGTNIELVCNDVKFDTSYSGGLLSVSNLGNVPIFGMKAKITGEGGYETKDLNDLSSDWPELGLNQGGTFSDSITFTGDTNKVLLIPVLIGSSEKGEKTFMCGERHGYEIVI